MAHASVEMKVAAAPAEELMALWGYLLNRTALHYKDMADAAVSALGLTGRQIFFLIILKPEIAKVYQALTSQIVLVMLGSAAVSQIAAEDLTFAAQYIQAQNFRSFEVYLVTTFAYLGLAVLLRHACRLIGRRVFHVA